MRYGLLYCECYLYWGRGEGVGWGVGAEGWRHKLSKSIDIVVECFLSGFGHAAYGARTFVFECLFDFNIAGIRQFGYLYAQIAHRRAGLFLKEYEISFLHTHQYGKHGKPELLIDYRVKFCHVLNLLSSYNPVLSSLPLWRSETVLSVSVHSRPIVKHRL